MGKKVKFALSLVAHQDYLYSPLDGMLVHCRVTPSSKFAGTHLNTWVERGTMRVKCLAQEHNDAVPQLGHLTGLSNRLDCPIQIPAH